jgi:hypothetical protein
VYRNGTFRFRNSLTTGPSDLQVSFGRAGDRAFVGDWDGDGDWTPGVLRSGVKWYLKDSITGAAASVGLRKQTAGTAVVGGLGQPSVTPCLNPAAMGQAARMPVKGGFVGLSVCQCW